MLSIFGLSSPQAAALGSVIALAVAAVSAYVFRAQRAKRASVVVCPPIAMPGLVEADGYLRVTSCSRLPDGHSCDQACVAQLAYSPDTLDIFLREHRGQNCKSCTAEITAADWYQSRMNASAAAVNGKLAKATHDASERVCWSCFVALNSQQEA
jgi:hypothetical protein